MSWSWTHHSSRVWTPIDAGDPVAAVADVPPPIMRAGLHHIPPRGRMVLVVHHTLPHTTHFYSPLHSLSLPDASHAACLTTSCFESPFCARSAATSAWYQPHLGAAQRLLEQEQMVAAAPGGCGRAPSRPTRALPDRGTSTRLIRLALRMGAPLVLVACRTGDDLYTVYDNPITRAVYRRWHLPLPLVRGLGPTLLPRPIQLTHHLAAPIVPPRHEPARNEQIEALFGPQDRDGHPPPCRRSRHTGLAWIQGSTLGRNSFCHATCIRVGWSHRPPKLGGHVRRDSRPRLVSRRPRPFAGLLCRDRARRRATHRWQLGPRAYPEEAGWNLGLATGVGYGILPLKPTGDGLPDRTVVEAERVWKVQQEDLADHNIKRCPGRFVAPHRHGPGLVPRRLLLVVPARPRWTVASGIVEPDNPDRHHSDPR